MTHEERKVKAVELLKQLDIYTPYIHGFEKHNHVCFFEHYAGFWAYQMPELEEKIKEIEERFNCTVYAVTHELTDFGECFDFLLVTDYEEEWDDLVIKEGNTHYAFAYVWNKDDDWCSELGTIGVRSFGGGITRVA